MGVGKKAVAGFAAAVSIVRNKEDQGEIAQGYDNDYFCRNDRHCAYRLAAATVSGWQCCFYGRFVAVPDLPAPSVGRTAR